MNRLALASLITLAACGGKSPATTVANHGGTTAPTTATTLYAPLFEQGRTFAYSVVSKDAHFDDQDPKAAADGSVTEVWTGAMTCTVAQVRPFGDGQLAHVDCGDNAVDSLSQGGSPSGFYVATAAGLWRFEDEPGAEVALEPAAMFIGAVPAARKDKQTGDDGPDFGSEIAVAQEADGSWCHAESSWGGDEGGWKLCFHDGVGPSSGSAYFAGGSTKDVTYELVK